MGFGGNIREKIFNIPSMEPSNRYLALDVLRGMTIALMILVNTPGSWQYVYPPLAACRMAWLHADGSGVSLFSFRRGRVPVFLIR